jgi:hypothetical protein
LNSGHKPRVLKSRFGAQFIMGVNELSTYMVIYRPIGLVDQIRVNELSIYKAIVDQGPCWVNEMLLVFCPFI